MNLELLLQASKVKNRDKRKLVMIRDKRFNGDVVSATSKFFNKGAIDTETFGLGDNFYGGVVKKVYQCNEMVGCYICGNDDMDVMGIVIDLDEIDDITILRLGSDVAIEKEKEYTDIDESNHLEEENAEKKVLEELKAKGEEPEGIKEVNESYVCGTCGFVAKSKAGLVTHMRSHK